MHLALLLALFPLALGRSNFFVLTDLHYDIAYEPNYNSSYFCHKVGGHEYPMDPVPTPDIQPLARFSCDSSFYLVESAISKMSQVDPNPDFIIITGDIIAHSTMDILKEDGTYDRNYNKHLLYVSHAKVRDLLQKYFPSTQIVPSIGNNDGYSDYVVPSGSEKLEYYKFLHDIWQPLVKNISPSFLDGGYYSTSTKGGYRIINLNSNFFSIRVTGADKQANEQLLWLEEELNSADKLEEKVMIAMHISPGVSTFKLNYDWHEEYIIQFLNILKKHQNIIKQVIAGHFHSTTFQLLEDLDIQVAVHPAVSPVFTNNPGFRYYTFQDKSEDYTDYFLNIRDSTPVWLKEYSFSELFHIKTLNYKAVFNMLVQDSDLLFQYVLVGKGLSIPYNQKKITKQDVWKYVTGLNVSTGTENAEKQVICCMKYVRNSKVSECVQKMAGWEESSDVLEFI